ncbi:hypothetical protein BCR44DRAFT_1429749 [Catenaria anguillulae PL171]|uniref:Class E vacuolar protein-sorting machinery protein HSE1 n=1 Tax=Catenaria anguillulae PL171 TaxID=765915 RepID=A0A1Y2HSW4_9FUNG|nr:hypothetical protein BCR44DRAFT_1429749 [Catenaria anguillulae PL171]
MPSIRELVDQATSESAIGEDWSLFLSLCDLVDTQGAQGARECVLAISKRVPHRNPNVGLLALSLTESLVKNCSKHVQREISSRQFTEVLVKALTASETHPKVKDKIRAVIEMCVQEYRDDPMLGYMADVKAKLVGLGHVFVAGNAAEAASRRRQNKHAAAAAGGAKKDDDEEARKLKEKEDLELAIALSLSEHQAQEQQKRTSTITSSTTARTSVVASTPPPPTADSQQIQFHVRALYDFPGTDRGELPFRTGDVIAVTDADYDDWWEGTLRGKSGLIPSNYVQRLDGASSGNPAAQGSGAPTSAPNASPGSGSSASLDSLLAHAANIDALLATLATLDPRTTNPLDHAQIQQQYRQLVDLRPALVTQLTAVRAKKDRVLDLNDKLTRARATYDRLMDEAVRGATAHSQAGYATGPAYVYGGMPPQPPNGYYPPAAQHQPQQHMGIPPAAGQGMPIMHTGGSIASQQPGYAPPPTLQQQQVYAAPAPNWSPPANQQQFQQQPPQSLPQAAQGQQGYAPPPFQQQAHAQAPMYQPGQ